MTRASSQSIGLTVAVAPTDKRAVKQFFADGRKIDYDYIKWWRFYPREYADMSEFAAALNVISAFPNIGILRGEPIPGLDLNDWHLRRLHSRPDKNEPATLRACSRNWIGFDFDDVIVRFGMGFAIGLADAAVYVRDELLPTTFWDKACVVTATASTGLRGPVVARLRMFFRVSQPIPDVTLRRWCHGLRHATDLPVDPAHFRP